MARKKKTPDEDQPNESENFDDSFGLPDIEYKPLDRDQTENTGGPEASAQEPEPEHHEEEAPKEEVVTETPASKPVETPSESTYSYSSYEVEDRPSMAPRIIAIIAIVLLAGVGVWYFAVYKPRKDASDKAAAIALAKRNADKARQDSIANAQQAVLAAIEKRKQDSLANLPKAGTIQMLSDRTGRYYVVIASDIDDDLLMDHAKKLSAKDVSTKIIPPYGKYNFYRLTIDDEDTYASAQSKANDLKGEYGDNLWVLHY